MLYSVPPPLHRLTSMLLVLGLLDRGSCSLNVICHNIIHDGDYPDKSNCYIKEVLFSNSTQETYNFIVDYARPDEIDRIEFVSTDGIFPTLQYFPREIFTTFPNLRTLRMTANLIDLDRKDFTHAMNLTSLDLRSNKLRIITSDVFAPITKERTLKQQLETDYPLHKLITLSLQANEIATIEAYTFTGLNHLSKLHIQNNRLTEVRRHVFGGLPSLESLDLESNQIETIEDDALNLPALEYLYLDDNKLRTLSDTVFDGLPALKFIRINNNRLEHIGRSFYSLSNVRNIKLGNNRIQDIDLAAFAKMSKLGGLTLSQSGFTFASTHIENDDHSTDSVLYELQIDANNLTDATELNALKMFPHLSLLSLDGNLYENLDVGPNRTLKDILPSLRTVFLRESRISCETLLAEEQKLNAKNVTVWHKCGD